MLINVFSKFTEVFWNNIYFTHTNDAQILIPNLILYTLLCFIALRISV